MSSRSWIVPIAVVVAACLLMRPLSSIPRMVDLLTVVCLITIVGFGGWAILDRLHRRRYDLGELRRVHDREELGEVEIGGVADEPDWVVCLHCGNDYHPRFPVCPRCGQR